MPSSSGVWRALALAPVPCNVSAVLPVLPAADKANAPVTHEAASRGRRSAAISLPGAEAAATDALVGGDGNVSGKPEAAWARE
mmetsp:Transcript_90979/g.257136  ORF Transcript_90979/g.257136 Transcript_90979/m.257136 type:complete len:83 (+) Transcript_90979:405-653(+)